MHAADSSLTRARAFSCEHTGLHSPLGQYMAETAEIRYVTVCDTCGAETAEVHRETYVPNFDPSGNDPYIARSSAEA
jgi:hypothetical protein